jgi:hypothetical protein
MNYTVTDEQVFVVRNNKQPPKEPQSELKSNKAKLADEIGRPFTSIEFLGMRDL